MSYLLPRDVTQLIGNHGVVQTANFALLFQRYYPDSLSFDSQSVHAHLNRVVESWRDQLSSGVTPAATAFAARHISAIQSFAEGSGSQCSVFTIEARSRLAVGLGSASAYENGLALHHTLGLPYIPGSSIKGIVRNWLLERQDWEELPDKAGIQPDQWDDLVEPVFGVQEAQGLACFWDAMPLAPPMFEVDIMNPHYGEYYQEPPNSQNPNKLPGDWYQPVPVFFLTVAPGAQFRSVVTLRPQHGANAGQADELFGHLKRWVKSAMEDWGVGAKTRKGYGQVQVSESEQ